MRSCSVCVPTACVQQLFQFGDALSNWNSCTVAFFLLQGSVEKNDNVETEINKINEPCKGREIIQVLVEINENIGTEIDKTNEPCKGGVRRTTADIFWVDRSPIKSSGQKSRFIQ